MEKSGSQMGGPRGSRGILRRVKRLGRVFILWAGVLCAYGASMKHASAQVPAVPSSELKQQYDAAFQETLSKPADLDVLFRFATLATQTGDLEGAVSALERMLLINPDLPRVRLELGVLYYRLGSYEVARTYLDTALKSPSLPADVRGKAQEYLAEIESKSKPSSLGGEVFFGWRYQSNANLGPAGSSVLLFGQPANLNQQGQGTADWGVVSSAVVRHRYDFGNQDKGALETQFSAYANRQFQVTAANVSLLDLTSGPRFQVFNGIFEDVTLKPFLTGGYVWVNDTPYYGSWGGGIEFDGIAGQRLSQHVGRRVQAPGQPGHQLSADQQPVSWQFHVCQHGLPVRAHADGDAVLDRERPAVRRGYRALAKLHAMGRRRRVRVSFPRPLAQNRLAVDHQSVGQRAVVDI